MNSKPIVISALLALAATTGVSMADTGNKQAAVSPDVTAVTKPKETKNTPAATAAKTAPAKSSARADDLAGVVREVLNGGGYSFFLVERDGEKFWVATPPTPGKVGDEMTFQPGIEMKDFKSKSLNRTFNQIYFSGGKSLAAGDNPNDEFLMKKAHSMTPPPAAATDAATAAKAAPAPDLLTGKVVEKLDGGGYSYFLLESDGKKFWVATPPTEGKVGEVKSFMQGVEMKEFKSKTLNKTFDSIIFSGGPAGSGAPQDAEGLKKMAHEKIRQDAAATAGKESKASDVKVEKAKAPNGYTVAEVYEKSGALNGKEVAVAGKVVKVSRQIMGKNWVHLQDGSGDASKGTNNLVTTTQDTAEVGDVVVATGKLAKDKDFGGGYQYAVIIEETKLSKK